jgi:hypothetical protein
MNLKKKIDTQVERYSTFQSLEDLHKAVIKYEEQIFIIIKNFDPNSKTKYFKDPYEITLSMISVDNMLLIVTKLVVSMYSKSNEKLDTTLPCWFVYISRNILYLLTLMMSFEFIKDDEKWRSDLCNLQDSIWLVINQLKYNDYFTSEFELHDFKFMIDLKTSIPLDIQRLILSYSVKLKPNFL